MTGLARSSLDVLVTGADLSKEVFVCRLRFIGALALSVAWFTLLRGEPAEKLFPGALLRLRAPMPDAHVAAVAFSPDGKLLATGGTSVRLYDSATGKEIRAWSEPQSVRTLAFSPDGQLLASGGLREVTTGKEAPQFQRRSTTARCLAFAPDGKTLAVGYDDRKTYLWDVATGKELRIIDSDPDWVASVAFSPEGKTLAIGCSTSFRLYAAATGKELRHCEGHRDWIYGLAFSHDGQTIASASADRTLRFWDAASGVTKVINGKHNRKVYSVAFSPTGRTVVSGGLDGEARLTEVATGQEIRALPLVSEILSVAFAPDGRRVASGHEDGSAYIWDITGWTEDGIRPPLELKPEELPALYGNLASEKAPMADQAKWRLVAAAQQAVPFLRDQLKGAGAERVSKLIAELDSDQFAVREKATQTLEMMGVLAEPALRKVLEGKPSLEVTRRVEKLLDNIEKRSAARWQMYRAMEALELIGTAEAKQVLESLKK